MKIRIKGNSVRYRLTKSELENFSKQGYLEEKTHFPSGSFTYKLEAKIGLSDLQADFSGNTVTVYFPDAEKETWFSSDRVGYEQIQHLPSGESLYILLEKDFVCLDQVNEDQSDNYPNPNLSC